MARDTDGLGGGLHRGMSTSLPPHPSCLPPTEAELALRSVTPSENHQPPLAWMRGVWAEAAPLPASRALLPLHRHGTHLLSQPTGRRYFSFLLLSLWTELVYRLRGIWRSIQGHRSYLKLRCKP